MATNIKCNHVSFFPFLYPKNRSSSDCDLEWLLLIRTYIHMHSNYDPLQEKHGSFARRYLNFKHGINLTAWIFRKQQEWLYHFLVMYVQADFSQYNWTDFRKQKVMPYKTIFSFELLQKNHSFPKLLYDWIFMSYLLSPNFINSSRWQVLLSITIFVKSLIFTI